MTIKKCFLSLITGLCFGHFALASNIVVNEEKTFFGEDLGIEIQNKMLPIVADSASGRDMSGSQKDRADQYCNLNGYLRATKFQTRPIRGSQQLARLTNGYYNERTKDYSPAIEPVVGRSCLTSIGNQGVGFVSDDWRSGNQAIKNKSPEAFALMNSTGSPCADSSVNEFLKAGLAVDLSVIKTKEELNELVTAIRARKGIDPLAIERDTYFVSITCSDKFVNTRKR